MSSGFNVMRALDSTTSPHPSFMPHMHENARMCLKQVPTSHANAPHNAGPCLFVTRKPPRFWLRRFEHELGAPRAQRAAGQNRSCGRLLPARALRRLVALHVRVCAHAASRSCVRAPARRSWHRGSDDRQSAGVDMCSGICMDICRHEALSIQDISMHLSRHMSVQISLPMPAHESSHAATYRPINMSMDINIPMSMHLSMYRVLL